MENLDFFKKNFDVPPKGPPEEFLRRWRKATSVLTDPKRRARLVADLMIQDEESDEEGGGDKKDKGGGDKGGGGKGGGGSEKKDKPDDSEKKDNEGGGRAGEKKDKTSGELRKMGANNVYGGWFMYGPGTCAEAVLDEPKQEEWLLTVVH